MPAAGVAGASSQPPSSTQQSLQLPGSSAVTEPCRHTCTPPTRRLPAQRARAPRTGCLGHARGDQLQTYQLKSRCSDGERLGQRLLRGRGLAAAARQQRVSPQQPSAAGAPRQCTCAARASSRGVRLLSGIGQQRCGRRCGQRGRRAVARPRGRCMPLRERVTREGPSGRRGRPGTDRCVKRLGARRARQVGAGRCERRPSMGAAAPAQRRAIARGAAARARSGRAGAAARCAAGLRRSACAAPVWVPAGSTPRERSARGPRGTIKPSARARLCYLPTTPRRRHAPREPQQS